MINVTTAFRQALYNDDRRYLEYADITLDDTNHTVLHVTNENIWQGGFSIEDSVGEDNTFSALGSTIINSCTIVLNNIYETYSEYDFTNAKVVVAVGLELPNPNDSTTTYIEKAWKGDFYVDEATYNGSIITLKCLDDMKQFDRPYSQSTLVYPATLDTIVRDACTCCGVELGTLNFPHKDYSIPTRPEDEKVTFREVIGWCATIAGCFARFAYYPTASKSKLELKWFNQTALEQHAQGTDGGLFDNGTPRYSTGDTLDGGTFNPWNTGDAADAGAFTDERPYHHIVSMYNHNISVDDVVITGVRTTVKDDDDDSATETITALTGTEGYVIDIADNEFITKTNATEIRTWLGQQLIGLKFRKASVSHPSDPSIEAGDIAFVYDRKGNEYPILVTRTVFNGFGTQTTVCGADTPNRNSATRYTQVTKSYVETRKKMKEQKNQYDQALDDLAEAIENAQGMYETVVPQTGGGNITYVHNKPTLAESDVVIELSSVGVTVTSNYSDPNPTWYGLTVTGNLVANLISALGVNFDWAVGTTLTLGGANNGNGVLRVLDANGNEVGRWNNTGLTVKRVSNAGLSTENTIENFLGASYGMMHSIVEGYYRWLKNDIGNTSVAMSDRNGTIKAFHTIIPELSDQIQETVSGNATCIKESYYYEGGTYKKIYTNEVLDSDDENKSAQEEFRHDGKFAMRYCDHNSSVTDWYFTIMHDAFFFSNVFQNYFYIPSSSVPASDRTITLKLLYDEIYINAGTHNLRINNSVRTIDGNTIQVTSSSKRYKHDITDEICEELDPHRLYDLKMKQFVYNDDHEPPYACMKGKTVSGFIAEDVDEIYPAAVIKNPETGEIESWSEAQIIAPMLSLIQEQKQQIDEQQKEIDELKKRIEKLEKLMIGTFENLKKDED